MSRYTFIAAAIAVPLLASQAMAQVRLAEVPARPGQDVVDENVRPAPVMISEAEVRSNLRSEGYSQIEIVDLVGATYDVQATKDGRTYQIEVDVLTGQVKSATPG